jgi:hypothetical protein
MAGEKTCFVCGCTNSHACPGGCYWVARVLGEKLKTDVGPLCSRCAHVLEGLEPYRAELTVEEREPSPVELVAFGLGVRAALRITRDWRP